MPAYATAHGLIMMQCVKDESCVSHCQCCCSNWHRRITHIRLSLTPPALGPHCANYSFGCPSVQGLAAGNCQLRHICMVQVLFNYKLHHRCPSKTQEWELGWASFGPAISSLIHQFCQLGDTTFTRLPLWPQGCDSSQLQLTPPSYAPA